MSTIKITAVLAAVAAATAYVIYKIEQRVEREKRKAFISEMLQEHDHLAEEALDVDAGVRARWANQAMLEHTRAVDAAVGGMPDLESLFGEEPEETQVATPTATPAIPEIHEVLTEVEKKGAVVFADKSREVTNHLVLRSKRCYTAALITECKNRFGTPERTNANRLAVRKFALDRMTAHGLRPTHIHQVLPMVVELVFCHSDAELEAARIGEAARHFRAGGGALQWLSKLLFGAREGN